MPKYKNLELIWDEDTGTITVETPEPVSIGTYSSGLADEFIENPRIGLMYADHAIIVLKEKLAEMDAENRKLTKKLDKVAAPCCEEEPCCSSGDVDEVDITEEYNTLIEEANKLDAEVSILSRELHEVRQELKIAHLEKDIIRLEKLALEHKLKEAEESLFRESLKKYEKIPNPYPQPSITPCPTPWDPWQRPWYVGTPYWTSTTGDTNTHSNLSDPSYVNHGNTDGATYTTYTNNTDKTVNEDEAVFTSLKDENGYAVGGTIPNKYGVGEKSIAEMNVQELMEAFWGNE